MKVNAENIISYLKSRESDMLLYLEQMVMAESPSRVKESHGQVQELLMHKLKSLNFYTIHIKGRKSGGHVFARPGHHRKNTPNQLLLGHSDTVWPLHTIEKMPFAIEEGKVKGPGVFDMKAGLAQIVFALECIKDLQISWTVEPLVFINSDEEIGSRESTKYIKWLSQISERAFVLEPPLGITGKLKTARKGLGRFTLEIQGKAAHAGLDPGQGASAILELSRQIQALFAMNNIEKGITVNVGLIEGGVGANVVAPTSKAVVDARVATYRDAELLTQKIFNLQPSSPEYTLKIDGAFGRLPMEPTEANQDLWKLAQAQGKLMGLELEEAFAGGGSDGNTTSQYTATLDGLGTTGDGAHAAHEFALTSHILDRTALLTLLILADTLKPV